MEVHNWGLNVGNVQVNNIGLSSIFLIGDNEEIILSSFLDSRLDVAATEPIVPLTNGEARGIKE